MGRQDRVCHGPLGDVDRRGRAPASHWSDGTPGRHASSADNYRASSRSGPAPVRTGWRCPNQGTARGSQSETRVTWWCRGNGRSYRYYVAQRVLKGDVDRDAGIVRRVSAAEIEAAVVGQVRALLRQAEVVVGTWLAARAEEPDLTEAEVREALERLDPLWDELFPAEQARIVRLLVERVEVGPAGADIRLRVAGLASLVRDLGASSPDAVRTAA